MSQKVQELQEKGPLPIDELSPAGGMDVRLMADDVRRFSVTVSRHQCIGRPKSVYYLESVHSMEDVVGKWLEVNSQMHDAGLRSLYYAFCQHSEEAKVAAKKILTEEYGYSFSDEFAVHDGNTADPSLNEKLKELDPEDVFDNE